MVLPKKGKVCKEDELLKKKIKKLFQNENFDVKPCSLNNQIIEKSKATTKISTTTKKKTYNPPETKIVPLTGSKRRTSIKNLPAKKIKKNVKSNYETQSSSPLSEFECQCSKSCKSSGMCGCYDASEDSEEFEKLKILATKKLKIERRKTKEKSLKSNGHSSNTDNSRETKENERKKSKKSGSKSQQRKYCNDSTDDCTDNTSEDNVDFGAGPLGCNSNKRSKPSKSNSHTYSVKTEPVEDCADYPIKAEKNERCNKDKAKMKKCKNVKINEPVSRKPKKSGQKLVPYKLDSIYPVTHAECTDSDETDNDEQEYHFSSPDENDSDDNDSDDDEGDDDESDDDESDDDESDDDGIEDDGIEDDDSCNEDNEADDGESNSVYSSVDDSDSDQHSNDYNFDTSSNDEDYELPENYEEDVYIPQGVATTYEINGFDVKFDSDNEPQIIEIATESSLKSNEVNSDSCPQLVPISIESDDSCPQLVPISFESQSTDFIDIDESSDSSYFCSEYSEATEGTLCELEDFSDNLLPSPAATMLPEIFELSPENSVNPNLSLNQFDYNFDSDMEIDNSSENVINPLNTSDSLQCKITTVGGVEFNISSKVVQQQQFLRRPIRNNNCDNIEKFETKFYNAIDSRNVLVLLRDPIYIYGTIKLKLIAGNIEIFGYQPDINEILEIFSPRGYSFLNIKSIKNKENIDETKLSDIILKDNYENIFLRYDLNNIIENFNSKTDALILLTRNDCNKSVNMLRKYMKENLFPNMNSITFDRPFYSSEFILHCLIRIQSQNSIHIDPKWQTIKINENTKSMIIGGKSVGKSTLTRYLINKNLKIFKKILLIDLDIGQPELFVPQTISVYLLDRPLIGPGYYLGLEPKKSLIIGDINVILSPSDYLKNVEILLKYCEESSEFIGIPWIINTMGYVKGIGNELIATIIKYLQPTDIIQLQSSKLYNNFYYLMYPNIVKTIPLNIFGENDLKVNNIDLKHNLILFSSIMNEKIPSEWDMKSQDMRYAMILTRLGGALNKCDWLTDVKPVCARIDDIEIISFGEDYISKDELLDVINANLVYLCNKSTDSHTECYGIGIIRGIDRFYRKIYLLPAVPLEILKKVNCFAVCNIPLPTSIVLNQGPKISGIVPYAYNTNKVIGSKSVYQLYNRGQKRKC